MPMKKSSPGSQCASSRKPSYTSPDPQGFSFSSESFGPILLTRPDLPPWPLLSLTALLRLWTWMQLS